MSSLSFLPKLNLKNLQEIEDYKEAHKTDFSQVFFKMDSDKIKSEQVGVYIKDIYNQDRVQPFKTLPGLHTAETCKLNAAAVANSMINYSSPSDFIAGSPGLRYLVVDGDFNGNVNYFLTANKVSETTTDPETRVALTNSVAPVSVEVFGYIAAQKPGMYRVDLRGKTPPKNMLLWIGNNALKTYRKENAMFIVENNVLTKSDAKVNLVVGEYTSFRMQYTLTNSAAEISVVNLLFNDTNYPITIFATSKTENNLFYYSLTPSDTTPDLYTCAIYKGSELQTVKTPGTQQEILLFTGDNNLPSETEFFALDLVGNLCAYDVNNNKLITILNFCNTSCSAGSFTRSIDESRFSEIVSVPLVTNTKWKQMTLGNYLTSISNTSEQVGDKQISIDKIRENKPWVSENFKVMIGLFKDADGNKKFNVLGSFDDNRMFYTSEPDIKMNKLFYASTFANNKYLKEVPTELKTTATSTSYSVYNEIYPDTGAALTSINCNTGCDATCKYFYKVTDSNDNETCLKPNASSSAAPTFLPKQPSSQYKTSVLKIKNPVIHTSDSAKNSVYANAAYIPNGFEHLAERRFSEYPVEQTPLSAVDVPGPEGTSYVTELLNQVHMSTSGRKKISNPIEMKPMIAGKIENFKTVNEDSMDKLADTEKLMNTYLSYQNQINRKKLDISGNADAVNSLYRTMSDPANNKKYDFTGDTIYSLEEDRSLKTALLKDNAIYLAEQNNLNLIGTITMATLIIAAIIVSK